MVSIRPACTDDLLGIQAANLACLPENYHLKYYIYHFTSWPELTQVAEDADGKIVGYVLAKLDDEDTPEVHGHITSLAVLRTHRKLGLATKLMQASQRAMVECHGAKYCSLHVRETNYAAFHLYKDTLKFDVHGKEPKYYADGEDAYDMRKPLTRELVGLPPLETAAAASAPVDATVAIAGAGAVPAAPPAAGTSAAGSAGVGARKRKAGGAGTGAADAPAPAASGDASAVKAGGKPASAADDAALLAKLEALDMNEDGAGGKAGGKAGGASKKGKKR